MSYEKTPVVAKALCLAAACFFGGSIGWTLTLWLNAIADKNEAAIALFPAEVVFIVVAYVYVRMFLAIVADGCLECLRPWCDGCVESAAERMN